MVFSGLLFTAKLDIESGTRPGSRSGASSDTR